jgi:antitoxin component of MazEF toxin-antitoxin module
MNKWTAYLEQEGDDLVLPIPDEVLKELNWREGDVLIWDIKEDGSIILRKGKWWYRLIPKFIREYIWR